MRCLVTGGAGFIGSNLVHTLVSSGHKVDVVDNLTNGHLDFLEGLLVRHVMTALLDIYHESSEAKRPSDQVLFIEGNFDDASVLRRVMAEQYDVVFHLAANPRVSYSVENPTVTTDENILQTVSLLEAITKCVNKPRFVFSSSCAVYGNATELPVTETASKNPESPYGWQKSAIEDFIKIACKLYQIDAVSLRYFNVYGPNQKGNSPYSTAISSWCDKVSRGEPLRFDGDGTQTRDMIYVGDVVNANILAGAHPGKFSGETINVGTGRPTTNNQIVDVFKHRFDNLEINNAPKRAGDVDRIYAHVQVAKDLLGFTSNTDLEAGLSNTFAWWKI
jgi:nucleoside-diphosphate-sugar epimerase